MTISSTTRVARYTGNGTASTFSFTFKVFSAADLFVQRVTIADGTTTTLVLTTDYTVSLNGNQNTNPGGSITLVAGALASSYTLTITSDIDNVQPTDLTNQGGFYPEVITDSLDRATIQIQQVAATANNAVHAPISDGALDMTLPVKELRTGKFLSFSAAGLPIVSDGTVTPDVTSGGNVTITANDAGANVDRDVVFVDNTTERMRLKGATGRLGIGTATPSSALHVVGDSTVTGNASVGLGMTVDTNVLVVDATNNRVGVNTTSPTVALDVTGAAAISGNLAVNTDTMFVNSAGNAVGIGTTAPFTKLGIHSTTSNTSMRITNATTGNPASNAGLTFGIFNNNASITNQQSGSLTFETNGTVGGTPALTLTSAGLFGVGSTTPAGAFHVTTGSTGAYFSRLPNDDSSTGACAIISTTTSSARMYGFSSLDFWTGAIGGAATLKMSIGSTGQINTGTAADSPYNNTTASAANCVVSNTGTLLRSTSSLKYKTNIQDMTHGLAELLALRPVTYQGKRDGNAIFGGLVAEEVHAAGLTEFVQYADDGSPDALAYGNMVALAIKAIQQLKSQVDALEARIAILEAGT